MPSETVFKVITEFEAENAQAIKSVVEYETELRKLIARQKEITEGKTMLTREEGIELQRIRKRRVELGQLIRQENTQIRNNTRLIGNIKRTNKELLNQEKQTGRVTRALEGLILSTFGVDVSFRRLATSTGRVAGVIGVLIAVFLALRDAMNRVSVFRDFFRDFFTGISTLAALASKSLGEFLLGNFDAFDGFIKKHQEAIAATNQLRNAQLKNTLASEQDAQTIQKIGEEIDELIRKRRLLARVDDTVSLNQQTANIRSQLNLIDQEIEKKREIARLTQEDINRRRDTAVEQLKLNKLLGSDGEEKILQSQLELQKIKNEEEALYINLNKEINVLRDEQLKDNLQLAAIERERKATAIDLRNIAKETQLIDNASRLAEISRLQNLLSELPEREQFAARQAILLLDEVIKANIEEAAIQLDIIANEREKLDLKKDQTREAEELNKREKEIADTLRDNNKLLQDQIIAIQLGPEATLGGIDRFITNVNRDFGNALTRLDTDINNQIRDKLKINQNIDKAFREANIASLRGQRPLLEGLQSRLEKELFDVITDVNRAQEQLAKLTGDELFSAAGVALARTEQEGTELIKALKDQIIQLENQLAALGVDTDVFKIEDARRRLDDLATALDGVGGIFGQLGSFSQDGLNRQSDLISDQIDLIDKLKESTLEANADIIKSEEEKLGRLIEGRRRYANQVRDFARLEFVANTAAAIAQAAASGPGAAVQIFTIVAAVLSGLAKLRSASVFHEGTESVGDRNGNKVSFIGRKLKRDEVPSILQKKERVLSVKQNAKIRHLSNYELVKAGEMYSAGFTRTVSKESRFDQSNNKLLKNIDEKIGALGFHVSMDQRGFVAGLYKHLNRQSKLKTLRK